MESLDIRANASTSTGRLESRINTLPISDKIAYGASIIIGLGIGEYINQTTDIAGYQHEHSQEVSDYSISTAIPSHPDTASGTNFGNMAIEMGVFAAPALILTALTSAVINKIRSK